MNHRCHGKDEGLAATLNYNPNSHTVKLLCILFIVQWANSFPLTPCKATPVSRMHHCIIGDFISLQCWMYWYSSAPWVLLETNVESFEHEVILSFLCWMWNQDARQDGACLSCASLASPHNLCLTANTTFARISKKDSSAQCATWTWVKRYCSP